MLALPSIPPRLARVAPPRLPRVAPSRLPRVAPSRMRRVAHGQGHGPHAVSPPKHPSRAKRNETTMRFATPYHRAKLAQPRRPMRRAVGGRLFSESLVPQKTKRDGHETHRTVRESGQAALLRSVGAGLFGAQGPTVRPLPGPCSASRPSPLAAGRLPARSRWHQKRPVGRKRLVGTFRQQRASNRGPLYPRRSQLTSEAGHRGHRHWHARPARIRPAE